MRSSHKIFWGILLAGAALFVSGLFTHLCVGDEVYHYRYAKALFHGGKRVIHDPLFESGFSPGYFYTTEPFWSTILALLWRLTGGISTLVAQVYQIIYFGMLCFASYKISEKLYGEKTGRWNIFLLATTPMIISFGILFYTDLPGVAWSTLSFWMALSGQSFWTGLVLGLTYLTKRTAFLLAPACFVVWWISRDKKTPWLKSLMVFCLPLFLLIIPDLLWRESHLAVKDGALGGPGISAAATLRGMIGRLTCFGRLTSFKLAATDYSDASLWNLLDVLRYFGLPVFFGFVGYLVWQRKEKKDFFLLGSMGFYFLVYLLMFFPNAGFVVPVYIFFPVIFLPL